MTTKCLSCGHETMGERHGTFSITPPPHLGIDPFTIENAQWRECANCGEQSIPDLLHRRLEEEFRRRQGLLSAAQIRSIRRRIGLSQEEMGRLLGVGGKTYTRWESGRSYHNRSSDNLLRFVDQHPELFVQLDAQRAPGRDRLVAEYVRSLSEYKGQNPMAMAAHGIELDPTLGELLRRRLKEIKDARTDG